MHDDRDLLDALTPTLHELLDRHLAASREWFPHELVPWERAADRSPQAAWDPAAFPLDEGVRSVRHQLRSGPSWIRHARVLERAEPYAVVEVRRG